MTSSLATIPRVHAWEGTRLGDRLLPHHAKEEPFRFTIDGDEELENHLRRSCLSVTDGVRRIVHPDDLEGLLLAGGYGRGEGGVLQTSSGDRPYNDMEFYVFVRGSTLLNDRRYKAKLHALGEQLSGDAGLDVEFKIVSLSKFRRSPVTMFSYDLMLGHHWLIGHDALLEGCQHHTDASRISLDEATRLLFNRCSGLLYAAERLEQPEFSSEDADFVGRNIAKAQLGIGDAILSACGLYHWSCLERHRRLCKCDPIANHDLRNPAEVRVEAFDDLLSSNALRSQLIGAHEAGTAFKLHPRRSAYSRSALATQHCETSALAWETWRRLESCRLGTDFATARDYAESPVAKCPGQPAWRNVLVHLHAFGSRGVRSRLTLHYPRQRLLHALALLLWHGPSDPFVLPQLQRELLTSTADFSGLVRAYESLWHRFN